MHVNRQTLLGRISKRPELRYNSKGTPYCSLTLAIEKSGQAGQVYTSWHQVEITGRFAEDLSVTLDAGDEILVEGEHQHRSLVDPKTSEKKKWCVLSTWGVLQRDAHAGVDATESTTTPEYGSGSDEAQINLEPASVPHREEERTRAPKSRRPRPSSYIGKVSALRGA